MSAMLFSTRPTRRFPAEASAYPHAGGKAKKYYPSIDRLDSARGIKRAKATRLSFSPYFMY
jgi:hypothetical protein